MQERAIADLEKQVAVLSSSAFAQVAACSASFPPLLSDVCEVSTVVAFDGTLSDREGIEGGRASLGCELAVVAFDVTLSPL